MQTNENLQTVMECLAISDMLNTTLWKNTAFGSTSSFTNILLLPFRAVINTLYSFTVHLLIISQNHFLLFFSHARARPKRQLNQKAIVPPRHFIPLDLMATEQRKQKSLHTNW